MLYWDREKGHHNKNKKKSYFYGKYFKSEYGWAVQQEYSRIIQKNFCQTPVLGLGLGVDFTFAGDNHKNHKNHKNHNNPHLNFVKGTVLGDKEQGVGIRDKGWSGVWHWRPSLVEPFFQPNFLGTKCFWI